MATKDDAEKEKSLALIVEEQRRDYDYLLHIYNRMRATEGLLLTAAFGILIYLYGGGTTTDKKNLFERLGVPQEDYAMIIYFAALAFFLYGIVKLTLNVFGKNWWETAYDETKSDYEYTGVSTLEHIKKRYDECQAYNCEQYSKRKENLTFLFYCVLLSAIILIVIKTLG